MRIGEWQDLTVERISPHGFHLTDGEEMVLLPGSHDLRRGDPVRAFIYTDSEDRPVATLKKPLGLLGDFVVLRVVALSPAGAFLDWGLDKDLLCPAREMARPMQEGYSYLVHIFLDQVSNRVVCSSKINRFLTNDGTGLTVGEKVSIVVAERAAESFNVIINRRYRGRLFSDEWHGPLQIGDVREAYIKQVREEDRKVAVSMRPQGHVAVLSERDRILKALTAAGGVLALSDKSSPEEINRAFSLSKGAFKRILGSLLKDGLIEINDSSIRLV